MKAINLFKTFNYNFFDYPQCLPNNIMVKKLLKEGDAYKKKYEMKKINNTIFK